MSKLSVWLSTLRDGGRPPPRKTRFSAAGQLYRVGLVTHRVPTKGFRGVVVTSLPPFPGFAWRNDTNYPLATVPIEVSP
jgi:hypothetical protein